MENRGNYGKNQHKTFDYDKKIGEVYMEGRFSGGEELQKHVGNATIYCGVYEKYNTGVTG